MSCWLAITSQQPNLLSHSWGPGALRKEDTNPARGEEEENLPVWERGCQHSSGLKKWTQDWWPYLLRERWLEKKQKTQVGKTHVRADLLNIHLWIHIHGCKKLGVCINIAHLHEEACLEPQRATLLCQRASHQAGLTHGDQMWPSQKIHSLLCSLFHFCCLSTAWDLWANNPSEAKWKPGVIAYSAINS